MGQHLLLDLRTVLLCHNLQRFEVTDCFVRCKITLEQISLRCEFNEYRHPYKFLAVGTITRIALVESAPMFHGQIKPRG